MELGCKEKASQYLEKNPVINAAETSSALYSHTSVTDSSEQCILYVHCTTMYFVHM